MEKRGIIRRCTLVATLLLSVVLTSCNFGRPRINGGNSDQPIMDGWVREQAAEFWLRSMLSEKDVRALKTDSIAHLTKGHVHVNLPVHDSNPQPRFDVVYRQPNTGGYITFRDTTYQEISQYDDTLQAMGLAHFQFIDEWYDKTVDVNGETESTTAYVESRGKGIYTIFYMERIHDRKNQKEGEETKWLERRAPHWYPAVVSVYPGGDSLLVSRGLNPVETFVVSE